MTRHNTALRLALPLLLAGCSDHSIVATAYGPVVAITSHADGDVVPQGKEVLIVGSVSHEREDVSALTAAWTLNAEPICEDAEPPDAEGVVRCPVGPLGLGTFYVALTVTDFNDRTATDEVLIETQVASAPEAIILSPDPQDKLVADEPVAFAGKVSDAEDPADDLVAWWESDVDGELTEVGATPDSLGEIYGEGTLSAGTHTLTLWVEDRLGKQGSDEVVVSVAAAAD